MNRTYDLIGLKLVILGCILRAIAVVLEAFITGLTEEAALLLELATSLVIFAGILRLCDSGIYFKRARNSAVVIIIIEAAMSIMLLLVNGYSWEQWALGETDLQTPIMIIVFIMLIIAGLATLVCAYGLLYGCRDIANRQGEPTFAGKCRKSCLAYLCGLLLSSVVEEVSDSLSALPFLSAVLYIVSIVVEIVVSIWVLLIFNRSYKLFHGQEIKELDDESERLPKDSRGSEQYRG